MPSETSPKQRLAIRAALVAGMLVSLIGLLAVLEVGPFGGSMEPLPLLARAQARVRIVDGRGDPVSSATVLALQREEGAPLTERWLPDDAVLAIPEGAGVHSFLVAAPGFRLQRIDDVRGDRVVKLAPGLRVVLSLRNAPRELLAPHIRFLLRIRPHGDLVEATPGFDSSGLVDLMDHLGGPNSGPVGLPRGEFGYAISRTQGLAGVRVPLPGRYHVHWGLMDLEAGTWYSLGDPCGRVIRVREPARDKAFELDVTEADLQRTLQGLRTSVQRLGED